MGTTKRERQKQGRMARLEQARAAEARRRRFKTVRNAVLVVVVVVVALFLFARGQDDGDPVATTPGATSSTLPGETSTSVPTEFVYGTGPCPAPDGSSPRTLDFAEAGPPQQCIDPARQYTAVFQTTHGTIRVALDTVNTPGTVNNFVTLARYHYYDGTDIFRSNTGIGILQGGSPNTQDNSDPGPGYDLLDEGFDFTAIGGTGGPYRYEPGDLVMARGAVPNGASAQWFFCVDANCANLDSQGVYVTFGSVVEGQEVLDAILALHQDTAGPGEGRPSEPVTVESITIEEV